MNDLFVDFDCTHAFFLGLIIMRFILKFVYETYSSYCKTSQTADCYLTIKSIINLY